MATNDQYRVSKDTSARKNTGNEKESNVHSDVEAAARNAGHEVCIQRLKSGYEEKMQRQESENVEQIFELKNEHEKEIREIKEQQQSVIDAEVKNAVIKRDRAVETIQLQVTRLQKEALDLRSSLDKEVASKHAAYQTKQSQLERHNARIEQIAKAHEQELAAVQDQVAALNEKHAMEIAALKRQVRIEIRFQKPGSNTRAFYYHPSTQFKRATRELCKDIGRVFKELNFMHKNAQILDEELSLEKLGIKEGDEISYTLKGKRSGSGGPSLG